MDSPDQILKGVRIASPCPASWDNMEGDERVRHCALCNLNVFNLSHMSRDEAATLVSETEGRLCVRYYQRQDGSVITRECPVGIRAVRKRLAAVVAFAFVLFTAGIALASNLGRRGSSPSDESTILADAKDRIRRTEPFKTVLEWIDAPQPSHSNRGTQMIGMVAFWPPPHMGSPVSGLKNGTPGSPGIP